MYRYTEFDLQADPIGPIPGASRGGFGHFTTRQKLQFNWIPLHRAADVMDLLAEADMHGIQTSGNCIRNTTSDALAGIAPDEIVDPRPYCELLRQWTTLHPEFSFLPREFKIAVTGAAEDRAATDWHDIGLQFKAEGGRFVDAVNHEFAALCTDPTVQFIAPAELAERFDDLDELHDIGDIDLHISGCINSCGHHHSGHIGILGVDKDGSEWYQVKVGGADGRLEEELQALAEAGVSSEVVPGITAATAAAADTQRPLTRRGSGRSVTPGHRHDPERPDPGVCPPR